MNEPTLVALSVPGLTAAAGIDPWKLQDQLLSGKPNQISLLAQTFYVSGSHTKEADDAFTQAYKHFQNAHASDNGCNAINDSRVVSDTITELKPTADNLNRIGVNLEEIAGALADAQNNTYGPIEALNRSVQQFDSEIVALPKHSHLVYEETRQGIEQDAAKVVHTVGEQLNGIVNDYENVLNARMTDIESTGYIPSVNLDDGAATTQLPPADTNPAHVNAWWNSLGAGAQQAILATHPDVIGNLNGIPVVDRSAANEQVMNNDIHRAEDAANVHGVKVGNPMDDTSALRALVENPNAYTKLGLTADEATRAHNALNVLDGLKADGSADTAMHSSETPPVYLFKYQPLAFGGKGSAAIAIGNPDTAANTAILVPGASQSVRASDSSDKGWLAVQSHEAQNLYVESNRANAGQTAVVAWMGYDDPPNGLTAVAFAPFEPHHGAAAERAGGILLAQDTNGLAATHQGSPSHVTWVGHSAGAIVVADAAVSGIARQHVNDVVLAGPVSTDLAHKAADFHLPPGHVYVGESSIDGLARPAHAYLNVMSHVLGQGGDADPTAAGYGATRFKAETPPSFNSWHYYNPNAHLAYFDPGSESLFSMGDIVSNNGHLAQDGMVATPDKVVQLHLPGRAGWEGRQVVVPGETTAGVTDDHYHPEK
ncbi:alpha/beta hydrolase family protein [Nocardia sp. NEAU-G5]|uniref:Alpha/beta hydrolase family protein n=1 Tax=Nocardia albiluteola TaxID=2842303 RepID=A0ABS6AY98_9NOCA|nr:alpha/beta hydrolase [Nocardia albiluteola]MBU3063019.1 alpha/beta hydrolase family protein [Nocardia albiluteola]